MTAIQVPDGYHTLSPYLMVEGIKGLLGFVSDVFGADVRRRMPGEAGGLHAEIELGDSVLMVGEGGGMSFPAMLHVYVEDSDAVYEGALTAGATSVAEPHDTSFGDHRSAFQDAWGNQWWVATRVGDVPDS